MSDKNSSDISPNLEENRSRLEDIFKNSADLSFRELWFDKTSKGFLVYLDGLVDRQYMSAFVIRPLLDFRSAEKNSEQAEGSEPILSLKILHRDVLSNSLINTVKTLDEVVRGILSSRTALFLEGAGEVLLLETFGAETRNVQQSETESTIRGPREGFVERIEVNASLLRRKIKDQHLRLEAMSLGQRTNTTIYVAYIEGIANPKIVDEVKRRLQSIDIDGILESGYIEQLIEDAPQSIFPTVGTTEKPDKLTAKLLEGRVGILVDGTPFVITVPYLFVEAFQNPEDYYSRPYYASLVRLIRYLAFYFSTTLPAFYVAIQTYHQEMVPTSLLISMSAGREGIPFPVIIEALGMGMVYEILREAGIRMPHTVGQAVSIVGALVVGEAAVQAGLFSQVMVILVALTVISGFLVPPMTGPVSLLRLYFLVATSFLGMFGWLMALLAIVIHLLSVRSFGIPYLSPIVPTNIGDLKDGMIRSPLWSMLSRPSLLSPYRRQSKKAMKNSLKKVKGS
ncbi:MULTISPECIES: spore germination protein [Desulfitobacterium]|uniref:Spore germination protein, GerA family n=1 Tax=Desulfitobacterium dehalogenans (strain ATCC 51507 / DSM 9161 / JW/IU-DC1) TaxID=756499 RepID=I4AAS6_DESDJ|nr:MULTISPECIES: spore germination protein [Desulfitobacterium]AFM01061.1 spore germination protein, GerA family [Desulfitobacterium dehalogenans ATCC 51507]